MSRVLLAWVVPGLVAAAAFVGGDAASDRARSVRPEDPNVGVSYLPTSEALKLVSMGYENVVADALWLRTVTYYGAWAKGDHGLDFFRELTHRVVDLDPWFVEGYKFGAFVLADDLERMDEAHALLAKGSERMPNNWEFPFNRGLLEYTVRLDDREAARWFREAAETPTAPDMVHRFAAFVTSRAGDLEKAYALWRFVAETTPNPDMRAKAEEYMEELQAAIEGTGPVPEWATRRRIINGRVQKDDDV